MGRALHASRAGVASADLKRGPCPPAADVAVIEAKAEPEDSLQLPTADPTPPSGLWRRLRGGKVVSVVLRMSWTIRPLLVGTCITVESLGRTGWVARMSWLPGCPGCSASCRPARSCSR
jgi:hypothetical protein